MKNRRIITIEGLKKHFPMGSGKFTALNGIDLILERGVCRYYRSKWFRKNNTAKYYRNT